MSFPFSTLDLLSKYIRHDVPIYCHDHPTQPDGMNACVKELETRLKAFELPDTANEMSNPVDLGTLKLRDNAGVFEISDDDGATWEAVGTGSGGVSDHTLLTNIGSNSHQQLDSHIADSSIHGATGTNTHAQIDSHIADTGIHGGGGFSGAFAIITATDAVAMQTTQLNSFLIVHDASGLERMITLPDTTTPPTGSIAHFYAAGSGRLSLVTYDGSYMIDPDEGVDCENMYCDGIGSLSLIYLGAWKVFRKIGVWGASHPES